MQEVEEVVTENDDFPSGLSDPARVGRPMDVCDFAKASPRQRIGEGQRNTRGVVRSWHQDKVCVTGQIIKRRNQTPELFQRHWIVVGGGGRRKVAHQDKEWQLRVRARFIRGEEALELLRDTRLIQVHVRQQDERGGLFD